MRTCTYKNPLLSAEDAVHVFRPLRDGGSEKAEGGGAFGDQPQERSTRVRARLQGDETAGNGANQTDLEQKQDGPTSYRPKDSYHGPVVTWFSQASSIRGLERT